MNVLCLAVYYSDTCEDSSLTEEACRGGEVSSHILIFLVSIVFQTLISIYYNVNIENGMESILFDQRMRGAAMNIYCKPPSKLQVNTEVCLCLKLL